VQWSLGNEKLVRDSERPVRGGEYHAGGVAGEATVFSAAWAVAIQKSPASGSSFYPMQKRSAAKRVPSATRRFRANRPRDCFGSAPKVSSKMPGRS
jgi:hypothetical protein